LQATLKVLKDLGFDVSFNDKKVYFPEHKKKVDVSNSD
jgi:hypothetical protein